MSPDIIVLLVLGVFGLALALRVPIAFGLALSGSVGLLLLVGFDITANSLGTQPFSSTAKFSLAVIPMYILMGMFARFAKLPEQLFAIANAKLRRLPGGLAIATVAACAGFAAVTGSSVATAATMGRLSIEEMRRYGYSRSFAAGVVAAAGTLGVLIPPSITLVLYGVVTGVSIGALMVAGVIPGIISAIAYIGYIYLRARREGMGSDPDLLPTLAASGSGSAALAERSGPDGASGGDVPATVTAATGGTGAAGSVSDGAVGDRPDGDHQEDDGRLPYRALAWIAVIFAVVIGGIYSGVFTATESGAVGATVAALIMIWELRHGRLPAIARGLRDSLSETAAVTSMVFAVVVGASIFSLFLIRAGTAARFTGWIAGLDVPPLLLVALLLLALIPLGMALETLSVLLIAVPLIHPVVTSLGFDGIWLGILVAKMIEIGLVTPPVGMNVYIVAGSIEGITAEDTFRGVTPFVVVDLLVVLLIFFVPATVLFLPSMMR